MTSEVSAKRYRSPDSGSRKVRNAAEVPVLDARIDARAQLVSLRKWVNELRDKFGFTYERIAGHTWRQAKSYGYWQSIANNQHIGEGARVRPCWQDYHDMRVIITTARQYGSSDKEVFAAAMEVVRAQAVLSAATVKFLAVVRKRTGQ